MSTYPAESFYRGTIRQSIANNTSVPFTLKVSKIPTLTSWLLTISPNTANEEIIEYSGVDGTALTITVVKRWISPSAQALLVNGTDYNNTSYQKAHSQNDTIRGDVNHLHIIQDYGNLQSQIDGKVAINQWVRTWFGASKLLELDPTTGNETVKTYSSGSSILTSDNFFVRQNDGSWKTVTWGMISGASSPIGSIRYSSIANLYGAWYELRSTATLATTDAWVAKATMGTARKGSAVWVISDKMYLAGGSNDSSWAFNTTEEYNFATNTWSSKATMPAARVNAFHWVVNGKLYVIGWSSDISSISACQNTTYEYDPVGNSWATKTNMGAAQCDGASWVYNGRIYCFGWALNGSTTALDTVQYYDVAWNSFTTWLAVITAAKRRCHMHGVSIGNKFYLGGWADTAGTAQNTFYEYNFPWNTWSTKTNLPTTIFSGHFAAAVVEWETKVFSLLWYNGTSNINAVYEYSPTNNNWTNRSTSSPVTTREGMAATYNNKIYVSGGNWPTNANTEYTPIKTKYEYERVS